MVLSVIRPDRTMIGEEAQIFDLTQLLAATKKTLVVLKEIE